MAILAVSLLAALLGAAPTPTSAPPSVAAGDWGGVGLRFVVDARGATVELDAARGTITGAIPLDAGGRFEADGTLVRERPGPARAGGADAAGEPARFRGTIEGDTLTLEITPTRSGTAIGPLHAKRGASARLRKMY